GALRLASEPVAGILLLLTFGILCLAILGVVYRRGSRRAFWLGFALFGWVYMGLASGSWWEPGENRQPLVTTLLLERVHPLFLPRHGIATHDWIVSHLMRDTDARNAAIRAALDQKIDMSFPQDTPLEDVLNYIRKATASPALPEGIPVYI